jgi:hypothetical protein
MYGNFDNFHFDPATGHREWADERELTAEEQAQVAADQREAEEAAVWEAHYGTEQARDEALEER